MTWSPPPPGGSRSTAATGGAPPATCQAEFTLNSPGVGEKAAVSPDLNLNETFAAELPDGRLYLNTQRLARPRHRAPTPTARTVVRVSAVGPCGRKVGL